MWFNDDITIGLLLFIYDCLVCSAIVGWLLSYIIYIIPIMSLIFISALILSHAVLCFHHPWLFTKPSQCLLWVSVHVWLLKFITRRKNCLNYIIFIVLRKCVYNPLRTASFVIVNYMDERTLHCTHKDLYKSLLETTPFCVISGELRIKPYIILGCL